MELLLVSIAIATLVGFAVFIAARLRPGTHRRRLLVLGVVGFVACEQLLFVPVPWNFGVEVIVLAIGVVVLIGWDVHDARRTTFERAEPRDAPAAGAEMGQGWERSGFRAVGYWRNIIGRYVVHIAGYLSPASTTVVTVHVASGWRVPLIACRSSIDDERSVATTSWPAVAGPSQVVQSFPGAASGVLFGHHENLLSTCREIGLSPQTLDAAAADRLVTSAQDRVRLLMRHGWRAMARLYLYRLTGRSPTRGPVTSRPDAMATLTRWRDEAIGHSSSSM